jgi:hypothetical protein
VVRHSGIGEKLDKIEGLLAKQESIDEALIETSQKLFVQINVVDKVIHKARQERIKGLLGLRSRLQALDSIKIVDDGKMRIDDD